MKDLRNIVYAANRPFWILGSTALLFWVFDAAEDAIGTDKTFLHELFYPTLDELSIRLVVFAVTFFCAFYIRRVLRQLQCTNETLKRELTIRERTERALRESDVRLCQLYEERDALSQNLSDHILKTINSIVLRLKDCAHLITEDSQRADHQLGQAIEEMKTVIQGLRSAITLTDPRFSKGPFLLATLQLLIDSLESAALFNFRVDVDRDVANRMTSEQATLVLQIIREAVSNSLKHSNGKSGEVVVRHAHGIFRLEVEDDGVGFVGEAPREEKQGLQNMNACAEELGGILSVITYHGKGTRIIVEFPEEQSSKNPPLPQGIHKP